MLLRWTQLGRSSVWRLRRQTMLVIVALLSLLSLANLFFTLPNYVIAGSSAGYNMGVDCAETAAAVTTCRVDELDESAPNGSRIRGVYTFTLVTAMIDIGRGYWKRQARSYDTYLAHLEHVLRLCVNLVVFVDKAGRRCVEQMRKGREQYTKIIEVDLQDLPYYKHRDRMAEIMASASYRQDNRLVKVQATEAFNPEYDIVQWSKMSLLNRTMELNPFNSSLFMWLDGGYGHGNYLIYPHDGVWEPSDVILKHMADKVTFMERSPGADHYRANMSRLHKMDIAVIPGGFIAGGKRPLQRLYQMQQQVISEWMRYGVVDDDQTTYMMAYYRQPQLFNLVSADWDDVFKLFNKHRQCPRHS